MKSSPSYRLTPWVGRLIIANAVILGLQTSRTIEREIFVIELDRIRSATGRG